MNHIKLQFSLCWTWLTPLPLTNVTFPLISLLHSDFCSSLQSGFCFILKSHISSFSIIFSDSLRFSQAELNLISSTKHALSYFCCMWMSFFLEQAPLPSPSSHSFQINLLLPMWCLSFLRDFKFHGLYYCLTSSVSFSPPLLSYSCFPKLVQYLVYNFYFFS